MQANILPFCTLALNPCVCVCVCGGGGQTVKTFLSEGGNVIYQIKRKHV